MGKSTHFSHSSSQFARLGGVPVSQKGAQDIQPNGVPSNWYPVNLPSATAGTPQNSDCLKLLNSLAPLVAKLTIQQSVALALAYRTVQSSVALGGNMTVNGVTAASTTFIDAGLKVGEQVAVDVVNKNPALTYDLAVRLGRMAAYELDAALLALYASASATTVGTAATTPTNTVVKSAIAELPVTGEPIFGLFLPATLTAMQSGSDLLPGAYQSLQNDLPCMGGVTGTAPAANGRMIRYLASENVVASSGNHNLALLPSFWALATADMGSNIASASLAFLTGTTQVVTSTALDPEFGTPQLALQLIISNTGTGVQTVYVNTQYAALAVNPANAVNILS
jgi:hypothetical protein